MPGWDVGLITSMEKYHCAIVCLYYEGPFDNEGAMTARAQKFSKKIKGENIDSGDQS